MKQETIFIYGAPASGKSTIGRALAEALGRVFIDLDARIVEDAGCSIPEIFKNEGEPAFRDRETASLKAVIAEADAPRVVSLGGGTLLRDQNRAMAEAAGRVVCIDTPDDAELSRRLGLAPGSRPLGNKAIERAPHYASFPNRIARAFKLPYSFVIVGKGFASALIDSSRTVFDGTVAAAYPELAAGRLATIPSGEVNKTPQTVMDLWHAFAGAGLGRKNTVFACGGGVTGDLTGFAAATWMRGIPWINVPTTLLSMVDASTGGKTGCDLPEGKNLAGAFHSPRLVLIDVDFLETLPARERACGRAEMIKHEVIGGLPWSVDVSRLPTAQEIAANLAVKVGIVEEDPFERTGKRMLLNCGHTIGHAVEKTSNYTLSHGESVAIGCVEEARFAVSRGLAPATWPEELAARFAAAGLPTQYPAGMDFDSLKAVMRGDKKREGSSVTFTLPCGKGDVRAVKVDLA